jgi:hypothetical protein
MANMKFDAYSLVSNPSQCTIIKPDKHCASVLTYSSVGYFNWGASIVGKEIELQWSYMTGPEFSALDALYQADTTTVFDPQDGESHTYNAKIKSFDGTYFLRLDDSSGSYRKDVKMTLLILSQVT